MVLILCRSIYLVALGDLDRDGDLDLVTANYTSNNVSVLLNGGSPEIEVRGKGGVIADGDATPSASDDTDFGSISAASGTVVHTFTIYNTGTADLTVSDITLGGSNSGDFSLSGISFPAVIAASGSAALQVTFDPSAFGLRTATVNITNTDADENPYDFAIQGIGDNTPPVAEDDAYTLAQDSVDNPLDVLANDSDANSDPLTVSAVDDPSHGTVVNQDMQLVYTPDAGYVGEDSFEYTVSDGQGGTDVGMVTITVAQSGNVVYMPSILKVGLAPLYKYTEDFEDGSADEWSDQGIETAPNDQSFLGEFGNDQVSLSLNDLPDHSQVKVTFDLYILRSWDGNSTTIGPDIWGVGVLNEQPTLQTTFSNWSFFSQAYPDQYPAGVNPYQTGALAVNTLGYEYQGIPLDATYHVSFTFDHTGSTLELEFFAEGLQPLEDESWGLDNMEVVLSD